MTDRLQETSVSAGWFDLADNLPGEAVRRHADELHAQWRAKPVLSRLLTPRTAELNSRRGAEAEEYVALKLSALGSSWHILHSVAVGRRDTDIDHIVIGPGGVFTVSCRNHQGKKAWVSGDILMVNGFRQPAIRDSRYNAGRASRLLSSAVGLDVEVRGVVVLFGTVKETIKEQPRDGAVHVSTPRAARRWIQHQPSRLTPEEVDRIYAVARRSSTWAAPVPARPS
jgi:hypothetical protein